MLLYLFENCNVVFFYILKMGGIFIEFWFVNLLDLK